MKIVIIGWYGTETIGDRAIIAGLISFFNKTFDNFELSIGSIYPFYSQRMINEDYEFWTKILNYNLKLDIFDSKVTKELNNAIKNADLVVMGGGPLMHISPMYMIEYAFKKAKKEKKLTAILGCGVGPIFKKNYKKTLINIIRNSDVVIFRDHSSKLNFEEISKEYNYSHDDKTISYSFDPAVEAALKFNEYYKKNTQDYIALNLRAFPKEYSKNDESNKINHMLIDFVKNLSSKFDTDIKMIPMHYFHIGEDDREFLNNIKLSLQSTNLFVQNKPLTLVETMKMFQDAKCCIGMRFHSIVLQTILNGSNYILDYTEPNKGKIHGFIQDIDSNDFYKNRYLLLQDLSQDLDFHYNDQNFIIDEKRLDSLNIYTKELEKIKEKL